MKPLYFSHIVLAALVILTGTTQAQSSDSTKSSAQPADYDKIFTKVEIEAAFPGGPGAWHMYLNKNLSLPEGKAIVCRAPSLFNL